MNNTDKSLEIRYSYKGVPTIKAFSESNAFIRGLMGPFGSGKSSGCVVEMVARALAQEPGPDGVRRSRWLVVRNTFPQLRDTTIRTVQQWLPFHQFGEFRQSDNRYVIKAFENVELELLFRALDRPSDVSNLLSLELTGAWVNEAREIPWAVIEALQGRVGRYPAKRDGGASWFGIIMDTNPCDIDSPWYKFFETIQHNPTYAEIFKQPSGLSKEVENLPNLPANYYTNLAVGKDPEWVKVYVEGKYGFVIDGRPVYPEYKDEVHCKEVKHISYEPIYRGWDFGLTPSCVFAQVTPAGQLTVIDEMVADDMGIEKFSEDVLLHSSTTYKGSEFIDVGDPAGTQRAQTDERTCFQILQSKGVNIEPGLQSSAIRLESVRKPLNRLVMGKPGFQLHPRCKWLRKGFMGGYCFRRLQTAAERYTEVPDKNMYSHPHDALQYICTAIFGGGLTSPRGVDIGKQSEASDFANLMRSDVTGY